VLATNGVNISAATKNMPPPRFKQLATDLQAGKGLAGTVAAKSQLATNVQAHRRQPRHHQQQLEPARLWGILVVAQTAPSTNSPEPRTHNHESTLAHPHFFSACASRRLRRQPGAGICRA
jgi:hypothetical protein